MAEEYGVFLRGVNVNGIKMKMDDLKKAFTAMGYPGAKTILATGNVIIRDDAATAAALKLPIEASLGSYFNYDANVFIRSAAELNAVISQLGTVTVPPLCHIYYLICDSRNTILELSDVFAALPNKEGEAYIPLETGAFWIVPVGETLNSAFGSKVLGDKKYKNLLTSRNMNTIEKINNAMRQS